MKAKKSLGQNFLKSNLALNKIIEAGEIKKDDTILEIGPGRGVLTERLLLHAGMVIAIEKDRELCEFLKTKFEKEIENGKLVLIEEDILKFSFAGNSFTQVLGKNPQTIRKSIAGFAYKIIANIPYNITGAILKKFLTEENQPERMVLLVQHEVATRIMARDKKESILSVSVKAYGEPKMLMKVPARYFSPAPKVDSAIISIKNISRKNFTENKVNEDKFWEIVKLGFAHKRKKLSGNLKSLLQNGSIASILGLGDKRAEDLTLSDWISLARQ